MSSAPTRVGEEELLAALRAGETPAFERLVTEYGPRLRATALRILRNEPDANDIVQETFVAAFKALDRFKGGSTLRTWLHRIAINTALMRIRSRKRKPELNIHEVLPRFGDAGEHLEPSAPLSDLPEAQVAAGRPEKSCAGVSISFRATTEALWCSVTSKKWTIRRSLSNSA